MNGVAGSIFHLHLLDRCNLRCLHCYSDSSPQASTVLPLSRAILAANMAASWGYRTLALSGGEPLIYPGLDMLLEHATGAGMRTSVVTNGLLCRTRSDVARLRYAGTVSVSIDGPARMHDAMRAREGAFECAASAVKRLADTGRPTWVSYGVTAHNVEHIEEVLEQAMEWGAHGVNFHLIEPAGRATTLAPATFLTLPARLRLYITTALLAAVHQKAITIHLDLLHRNTLLQNPSLLYANGADAAVQLQAEAVRFLVMNADGGLAPACHGIHLRYAVGHPEQRGGTEQMWQRFFSQTFPALIRLGCKAYEDLRLDERIEVVNPGDWLAERSHRRLQLVSERLSD